ncbi:MAG TPA: hypothetical protein PLM98_03205 [Thiolinea sp.]|nr:hypothetical protein [Thiolinea sp.]
MKLLHSRPILYFVVGLFAGANLGYLFEFNDKYSADLDSYQLGQLLNLLGHLTIWGVILGGVTILLSRGIALIFLDQVKKAPKKTTRKS